MDRQPANTARRFTAGRARVQARCLELIPAACSAFMVSGALGALLLVASHLLRGAVTPPSAC